jgi:hypothetical protein
MRHIICNLLGHKVSIPITKELRIHVVCCERCNRFVEYHRNKWFRKYRLIKEQDTWKDLSGNENDMHRSEYNDET